MASNNYNSAKSNSSIAGIVKDTNQGAEQAIVDRQGRGVATGRGGGAFEPVMSPDNPPTESKTEETKPVPKS